MLLSLALAAPVSVCHRAEAEAIAASWSELADEQRRVRPSFAPPAVGSLPDPETCIAPRAAEALSTEHFVVEWDEGGVIDSARAQDVADALELSWTRLFDDLGWRLPEGTGTYRIRVWLTDEPFEGGFTQETTCEGLELPAITIGAGTFDWGTWYQDVAAHELLHASHYRYGRAFDNWWWEATAIWIQEQVYPDNDEWAYYVDYYLNNPWWPLAETTYQGDRARHMYGTALWVFWLEQEHGGHDFVQELWERSAELPATEDAVMDDVLGPELDMAETFTAFAEAIPLRLVGDEALYQQVVHEHVDTLPSSGTPEIDERPEAWGMNYLRFTGDALAPEGLAVDLTFREGSTLQISLLGVIDGQVAERVAGVDDEGTIVLPAADGYDEAWLVAVAHGGDEGQYLAWTARRAGEVETTDSGTVVDTGQEPVDPQDEGDDVDDKGCGCSTGAGSWRWWPARR